MLHLSVTRDVCTLSLSRPGSPAKVDLVGPTPCRTRAEGRISQPAVGLFAAVCQRLPGAAVALRLGRPSMQAALEHVRTAVAFDARGEVAQAVVAYEAGIDAMKKAAAVSPLDPQTHAVVWAKIGEYYARAEELKLRIASAAPPVQHKQQQQLAPGARLDGLRAFHADLESGAVAGGYGKDQLRERLDALRGRPSAVAPSKQASDTAWLNEEAPDEEEQIAAILQSARDEAAVEERGAGPSEQRPELEERFYRQLKKDASELGPAANQTELLRDADAAVRDAAKALGREIPPPDPQSASESDSGEYSDEEMEKRRQKEKAHQRQLRAKAKARMNRK